MNISSLRLTVVSLLLMVGCDKIYVPSCLEESEQTAYYESEIFDEDYLDIYGKWELFSVTGGFTGGGHDFSPKNYLYIIPFGKYGFLKGDSTILCGKIVIPKPYRNAFLMEFENLEGPGLPYGGVLYAPEFKSKDTLYLRAHCSDCFNYNYKRM